MFWGFWRSWGYLGRLGAILGHLGAILGLSWAIYAPSGGHLGPSWGHLGANLGQLGANFGARKRAEKATFGRLAPSWPRSGPRGPFRACPGPLWGSIWGSFWACMGALLDLKRAVSRFQDMHILQRLAAAAAMALACAGISSTREAHLSTPFWSTLRGCHRSYSESNNAGHALSAKLEPTIWDGGMRGAFK